MKNHPKKQWDEFGQWWSAYDKRICKDASRIAPDNGSERYREIGQEDLRELEDFRRSWCNGSNLLFDI